MIEYLVAIDSRQQDGNLTFPRLYAIILQGKIYKKEVIKMTNEYSDIKARILSEAHSEAPNWVEYRKEKLGDKLWPSYTTAAEALSKEGLLETGSTFDVVRVRKT